MLAGNDRSHVGLRLAVSWTDFDGASSFHQRGQYSLGGIADHHRRGCRHTAFAGAAISTFYDTTHRVLDIRIRHEENEILCAAIGLNTFTMPGAGFKNVLGDGCRADERNGFDLWMLEQGIDAFAATMDDIEDAFRKAGLFEQPGNFDCSQRHLFARLEDESVAADQSHWIHPQWHHRRKVERGNAGAHAKRLADRIAIDAARDVLDALPHQQ